jgi:IS30 family transposase
MKFIDEPVSPRYFNQDDRILIADCLSLGIPVKEIARRVGKSYQSVYREIARNRKPDGTYQPFYAHGQAYQSRRRPKVRRFAADDLLRQTVAKKLTLHWSPSQISRWLRRRWSRRTSWHVCPETIYESTYLGLIVPMNSQTLRTGRTYRHTRGRGRTREGALKQLTKMRSIHDRPKNAQTRRQVGHWEGDLILGSNKSAAIATLVDRKTRMTLLIHLPRGYNAKIVSMALIDAFRALPLGLRRTLTWDQGNEMFQHEATENATGVKMFFADAHSPWQRGTNENTNGLLRQYFPKGSDLATYTSQDIQRAAEELNNRPRAVLGDKSPTQLMQQWEKRSIRNVH